MKIHVIAIAVASVFPSLAAQATEEPIQPIKTVKPASPAMVELGKKLYFDPRLSKSGFISCNSCHNLSMGGTDNLKTSIGHNWNQGPINAPTVLNSSMNVAQFWDGRAKDLQAQAGGPIANPGEMASSHELATPPNSRRCSAPTRSPSPRSRKPSPLSRKRWSAPTPVSTNG